MLLCHLWTDYCQICISDSHLFPEPQTSIPRSLCQSVTRGVLCVTGVSNRHTKLIMIKFDWMFLPYLLFPRGPHFSQWYHSSTSLAEHNLDLSQLSFSYSPHPVHQETLKRLNLYITQSHPILTPSPTTIWDLELYKSLLPGLLVYLFSLRSLFHKSGLWKLYKT